MGIDYVDGRRFRRAIVAGAEWVLHTRETLNRLNVFPVPDGDTGTNMALSLSATAGAARGADDRSIADVSRRIAEASVLGAKGNSGLILAHWFLGLSLGLEGNRRIRAPELAHAMDRATRAVYDALEEPVEGTIITVMRASADAARQAADAGRDVEAMLDEVIEAAERTLAETPTLLAVLAEARVVDAGAAGYVNFMKGVRRVIRGEPPPDWETFGTPDDLPALPGHRVDGELGERYCTEVIVRGHRFDTESLRHRFRKAGSFLLVAATSEVFKLHVHTDHPDAVFREAAKLGTIEERKVDDMRRQRDERAAGAGGPLVPLSAQPGTVAIVCDSTCDLPDAVLREHAIERVPLQVLFGDEVFRDQVDLTSEEFYARLEAGGRPTTSQPPPRAFVEALERIRADRDVVVLTIAGTLSGTWRSAASGARVAPHPRVEVVDSGTASLGLGLLATGAARLAAAGATTDEVLDWLRDRKRHTGAVFTVATLEYLRRGGRIGAAKSLVGKLTGVRPVLAFGGERVEAVGRVRGDAGAIDGVLTEVARRVRPGARVRFGLVSSRRPEILDEVEPRLRETWDVVEVVRGEMTGVIGTHTGPGAWGVLWVEERAGA